MILEIDIPEQIYLNAKADTLCGADILVSAIKNGTRHETVTEFADRCRECGREKVLDKIRSEIEQIEINGHIRDVECFRAGINIALNIIDKYKAESEDKE